MVYHISYLFDDSKRNEYLTQGKFSSDIECFQFATKKKADKNADYLVIYRKTSRGWKIIYNEFYK